MRLGLWKQRVVKHVQGVYKALRNLQGQSVFVCTRVYTTSFIFFLIISFHPQHCGGLLILLFWLKAPLILLVRCRPSPLLMNQVFLSFFCCPLCNPFLSSSSISFHTAFVHWYEHYDFSRLSCTQKGCWVRLSSHPRLKVYIRLLLWYSSEGHQDHDCNVMISSQTHFDPQVLPHPNFHS